MPRRNSQSRFEGRTRKRRKRVGNRKQQLKDLRSKQSG